MWLGRGNRRRLVEEESSARSGFERLGRRTLVEGVLARLLERGSRHLLALRDEVRGAQADRSTGAQRQVKRSSAGSSEGLSRELRGRSRRDRAEIAPARRSGPAHARRRGGAPRPPRAPGREVTGDHRGGPGPPGAREPAPAARAAASRGAARRGAAGTPLPRAAHTARRLCAPAAPRKGRGRVAARRSRRTCTCGSCRPPPTCVGHRGRPCPAERHPHRRPECPCSAARTSSARGPGRCWTSASAWTR